MPRRVAAYFFRGLVLLAPVAVTVLLCVWLFQWVDGWLGLPIPGAGFVVTIAIITLVGFLGSNLLTRGALSILDRILNRLPFISLVYGSSRDLIKAFVGEKRRFDKPVMVQLFAGGNAHVLGFVTQETMEQLGQHEMVAVYVPQSYNWGAGQLYLFPPASVTRLDMASPSIMAFILSGGVTEMAKPGSARTAGSPS